MNHRRHRPRLRGTSRSRSSSWSWPQTEKGDSHQSRANRRRAAEAANNELRTWGTDPTLEYTAWVYGYSEYSTGEKRHVYPVNDDWYVCCCGIQERGRFL